MLYKFLIASTYDYIRNTWLCLLSTWMLYHYYLQCLCLDYYMSYLIHAAPVHPSLCLQCFNPTVYCNHYCCLYLLLLLFHRYYCYKTVATDNLCRARLFTGAAELTTPLLRLSSIFGSPCVESINWVLLPSKTVAIHYTCGSSRPDEDSHG